MCGYGREPFKRGIENLITNAVQEMDNGGLIDVNVQSHRGYIVISIKDTAGGISEEIVDNLFEPFKSKDPEVPDWDYSWYMTQ